MEQSEIERRLNHRRHIMRPRDTFSSSDSESDTEDDGNVTYKTAIEMNVSVDNETDIKFEETNQSSVFNKNLRDDDDKKQINAKLGEMDDWDINYKTAIEMNVSKDNETDIKFEGTNKSFNNNPHEYDDKKQSNAKLLVSFDNHDEHNQQKQGNEDWGNTSSLFYQHQNEESPQNNVATSDAHASASSIMGDTGYGESNIMDVHHPNHLNANNNNANTVEGGDMSFLGLYFQQMGTMQREAFEKFYENTLDGPCQALTQCEQHVGEHMSSMNCQIPFLGDPHHQPVTGLENHYNHHDHYGVSVVMTPRPCEYCHSIVCVPDCDRPELYFLNKKPPFASNHSEWDENDYPTRFSSLFKEEEHSVFGPSGGDADGGGEVAAVGGEAACGIDNCVEEEEEDDEEMRMALNTSPAPQENGNLVDRGPTSPDENWMSSFF